MMNRLSKIISGPLLLVGLIAGAAAAYLGNSYYVYWATSGYSQSSYLLMFENNPSEEMFLDAVIQKEPLIKKKQRTTQEWREVQSEGGRLKIKLDNNRSVAISPYSSDKTPDTVFSDGGRVKGIWLTEPQTRIHFPALLVRAFYFLGAFLGAVLALLLFQWLWYFILARVRELSQAIRGGVEMKEKNVEPTDNKSNKQPEREEKTT